MASICAFQVLTPSKSQELSAHEIGVQFPAGESLFELFLHFLIFFRGVRCRIMPRILHGPDLFGSVVRPSRTKSALAGIDLRVSGRSQS